MTPPADEILSTTGAPLLALRGVGKRFANAVTALDGLDMEVRQGEFLSLLGPSGCGKSTALRLIAGLSEPTAGRIDWNGADAPRRAGGAGASGAGAISFVFQEPTLMPWANVFANVHLPLRLSGVSRREAEPAILEALEMVGLSAFREAYPRELSGGMKMRVSIARALVTKPRLLLMDEPFAALDEITRFKLNNDLLQLWRQLGCTIVFVTHSVFESVFLSSRILVFRARPGRVFAEVSIDPAQPRDDAFRTSPEYAGLCRQTSTALARAMDAGAG
ncbi:NitT/TauT family transport system ATP-binding protein [Angulomicrobium tetraedrale]|uniref:NitT/TauT family transport system ATP-binding protein n=1 Tax=Ancylobacter tetraedralis TaxID=217068 RepID=A0A839ZC16_9HYPH|nr:ABC transporter ATP-binding protein [Ancylobacter tetraedralis]MBB3772313.1 NitT/TauT family transport system ATP-binding protein [Ancylobacter tetraedralis]